MDPMKFTVRDFWHLFDKDAEERWRQEQLRRMNKGANYMDGSMGLRGLFLDKWQKIPEYNKQGLDQLYNANDWGAQQEGSYIRHKYPKPPKTI